MKLSKLVRITFDEEHLEKGAGVIFRTGEVVFLGDNTVLVPEESIRALKKKRIPFIELERENGSLRQVRNFRASRVR
jgi:hypothetical protein